MFEELIAAVNKEGGEYQDAAGVVATAMTARDTAQTALEAAQGTAGTERDEYRTALLALGAAVQAAIDELA